MPKDRANFRKRQIGAHVLRPETLMMSYGYDPQLSEGAVKSPIFQTSTFVFKTAEEGKAFFELAYGLRKKRPREEEPGLIYSRINNPDLEILEDRLTLWDEAESALVFSSGMAAIATSLFTFLRPGDVVVYSEPVYGGSDYLITHVLPQFGVQAIPFSAHAGAPSDEVLEQARAAGRFRMIYIETPANPTNALVDIAACAHLAKNAGSGDERPLVVVDNTFLGPLWQKPLRHGADLVLYSLTKYVGGHSDLIAGACLGAEKVIAPVRGTRTILGTISDAWTGWLTMRSLETLKLRMTCSMKNARYIAEYLNEHHRVKQVHYLGFLRQGDAQYEVFRKQCESPGSTFSFEVHGGEAEAFRVLNALKLIKLAVSLGGTESLSQHPASMTHSDIPADAQARMGITPGMIRLSVGIEHPEDIIADLEQALAAI